MMAMLMQETVVLQPGATNNYDMFVAAGSPTRPVFCICIVDSAIGSASAATPAFTTGSAWSTGSNLVVVNNSTITGGTGAVGANGSNGGTGSTGSGGAGGSGNAGGAGSAGSSGGTGGDAYGGNGTNGSSGGIAFTAGFLTALKNAGSIVRGAGGAGGAGGGATGGSGVGGGGGLGVGGVNVPAQQQQQRPTPSGDGRRPSSAAAPASGGSGGLNGGGVEVRLTKREAASATDGTLIFNYDDPTGQNRWKKGDPIGLAEMARRKHEGMKNGLYDKSVSE